MEKPVFRFTEPKKKKKKRTLDDFGTEPFPIPVETLTGRPNSDLQWNVYQGRLIGSCVIVESQNDMDAIYQMGFFGKGNLSWSAPEYNIVDKKPKKNSKNESYLRLLSKRRYLKHLEWKKYSDSQQASSTGDIQSEEYSTRHLDDPADHFAPPSTSSDADRIGSNDSCFAASASSESEQTLEKSCSTSTLLQNLSDEQLCEDLDGDAVVKDDSDEDDDNALHENKETVVFDPFPLRENLQLSLEESFFLSYGLGCLVVSHKEQPMDLTTMWSRFSKINPNFVDRYVAYHNFRSKGWVVRSGMKYGVDFNLYKKGPPFYHSSYSVLVVGVDGKTGQSGSSNSNWTSLCCLNRVTQQVSKELMICYVMRPKDLSDADLQSPNCISKLKVSEFIIGRWVSKKERENAEYLEIP